LGLESESLFNWEVGCQSVDNDDKVLGSLPHPERLEVADDAEVPGIFLGINPLTSLMLLLMTDD